MDKNTIIAIVVIFLLVIVFQYIFIKPQVEQKTKQATKKIVEEQQKKIKEEATKEKNKIIITPKKQENLALPAEGAKKEIITVDTNVYTVKLDTEGAKVISFKLKKYLDKNGKPVELVKYKDDDVVPFEVHFDRLKNTSITDKTLYFYKKTGPYSYIFFRDFKDENGNTFRLEKTYKFDKSSYMFTLKIKVQTLDVKKNLYINKDNVSYTLAWGPVLGPSSVVRNRYNVTTEGYHEAGKYKKVLRGAAGCTLRRGEARYIEISRILDWVGVTNRYFFIGIIPDKKNYIFAFDQRSPGKYLLGISHPYFRGKGFEDDFNIYVGPKDRKLLKRYGHDFESVMSGRILKPIVIFLEIMIKLFYRLTKNYGISIILMTIVIKIILHPLTYKSFQSMKRMSALQPKINEIRDKYKSNPQQMNKEISALYKREKVNPMGGCLPMLLQLPIFYALYALLSSMIELRNQSFLWIKDLSLPDTVATIKMSIPLLGYKLGGHGYTDINILPFIMTATTLLQSKLTSGDQSSQQGKMMTYLFPLMFFFIFWNMPSGLVLYWTIQNILTIGQQLFIDYRIKKRGAVELTVEKKKSSAKKRKLPSKKYAKKYRRR